MLGTFQHIPLYTYNSNKKHVNNISIKILEKYNLSIFTVFESEEKTEKKFPKGRGVRYIEVVKKSPKRGVYLFRDLRDKTIGEKLCTSPMMILKITPSVDYNLWL